MSQTVEAVIDANGMIRLVGNVSLPRGHRALVTILDEKCDLDVAETALLSEESLSDDWLKPEEDEAWLHLQSEQ